MASTGRAAAPPKRALSASDRRVARQALWLNGALGIEFLSGAAQLFITARILGPEGFGALAVIAAVATLIHGLATAPGGDAVAAFGARAAAERRTGEATRVLRFTLAASLGLSLAAYAVIALLASASGLVGVDSAHREAALLYGLVGVFMATQTETQATLRMADRVPLAFAAAAAGALTRVGLLAAAWEADAGIEAVVFAYVAGAAVYGAGMLAATVASAHRAGMSGLLRSLSMSVPSDVKRFQIGIFGRTIMEALSRNAEFILVAQATGAQNVGLYRAARQVMDAAQRPIAMARLSAQTEQSRLWRFGLGEELRRSVLRFTLFAFALAAAGFGLLAVFREPIVRFILGEAFLGSAPVLLILIPAAFVANAITPFVALPLAAGRIAPYLWSLGSGLAVSTPAYFLLASAYGAEGAAFARITYIFVARLVLIPFAAAALRESRRLRPPADIGGSPPQSFA